MSDWYYIKSDIIRRKRTIGPVPDSEFFRLVKSGSVSTKTPVLHEVVTRNQWVDAESVPAIQKYISRFRKLQTKAKERLELELQIQEAERLAKQEAKRTWRDEERQRRLNEALEKQLAASRQRSIPKASSTTTTNSDKSWRALGGVAVVVGITILILFLDMVSSTSSPSPGIQETPDRAAEAPVAVQSQSRSTPYNNRRWDQEVPNYRLVERKTVGKWQSNSVVVQPSISKQQLNILLRYLCNQEMVGVYVYPSYDHFRSEPQWIGMATWGTLRSAE
jgi:hypothetical protein